MKIVGLKIQNIQRVEVVEIRPDGNMIVIGGRNGAGKSSTLDAIWMALAGKRAQSAMAVRKGAKEGKIELELDEDIVIRKIIDLRGDERLEVTTKNGAKYPRPQDLLNSLLGKFRDPLEFKELEPEKQLRMLKELVGLDFSELDAKRAELYTQRSAKNKLVKEGEIRLAQMPTHPDVGPHPIDMDTLKARIVELRSLEQKRAELENDISNAEQYAKQHQRSADAAAAQIEQLTKQRATSLELVTEATEEAGRLRAKLEELPAIDTEAVQKAVEDTQEINRKVAANRLRAELAVSLEQLAGTVEKLGEEIEQVDAKKAAELAAAAFPVPGLGFGEHGVTFQGVPFEQISSAEQLRVSVAMGIAANPKLRVLLIRNGSLLDDESLALVAKMAEEHDAQLWIERVGKGKEVTVVIENGRIEQQTRPAEAGAAEGSAE